MNKKIIFIFTISILIFVYIFLLSFNYVKTVSSNLSNNVLRLHIIANSDSNEDQNLKLKVRDNIIKYMNDLTSNCKNKSEVTYIVSKNLENFKKIATNTIKENGYDYTVTITLGNYYFPTKSYGDISFPAGNYDALKIEIGKAVGQNWWCVLFPPLCFVSTTGGIVPEESKNTLKNNINSEEYQIISDGNSRNSDKPDIKIKFKLIEFFNNLEK